MAGGAVNPFDQRDAWFHTFTLVGSLVLAGVLLVFLRPILVPFVLATFLAYLVRPFAELISTNLCFCRRRRAAGRALHGEALSRDEVARLLPEDDEERAADTPAAAAAVPPAQLKPGATLRNLEEAAHQVETALPHWVGVVLAISLALTFFVALLLLMAASISSLGSRLDDYQLRARELWAILVFNLRSMGLNLSDVNLPSKAVSATLAPLLNASLGLLNDFLLVFIFLVFLLLEPAAPRSSLRKRIDDSISRYIILKSLVCLGLASFTFLILTLLGFPLSLFLAIATYILTFVPNLGPLTATLLPLPICLLDTSVDSGAAALAVILPGLAHVLTGNLLEPHLFSGQFRMSPVIILFSIGVWFILWGLVGAMLAVPLTSVLRIITSDLMQSGAGGPYVSVLNSLLEGRPLDVALPGADLTPTAAPPRQPSPGGARMAGGGGRSVGGGHRSAVGWGSDLRPDYGAIGASAGLGYSDEEEVVSLVKGRTHQSMHPSDDKRA